MFKKKKKERGRKALKISLIVLGSLLALIFLLLVFISPIAHWYIEKNSKELFGRVVTMDDLKINVFKGIAEIDGFVALEQNDRDTFATFDRLYVDITLKDLLHKTVRINEITLNTPKIVVIQYKDRFNFTDIIEHFTDDEEEEDEEESGWTVDLRNITITGGNVIYRDAEVGSEFDLRQLAINVPQIYFSTEQTDVGLDLQFANGGGLNVKLLYGMEDSEYDLSVKLKDFELKSITPYLKQYYKIHSFNGLLTADVNVKGNIDHILDVVATGKATFSKLSATDLNNEKLATVETIEMGITEANTKTSNYHLSKFEVSGANFNYEIFKDHSSFDDLFVEDDSESESAEAPEEESSPMHLLVDELILTNTSFHYIDHTMHELVDIPFSQVDIRSSNFDWDKTFNVKVNATVAETGKLRADWTGSLDDFSNMKLNAFISNFKLTAASPYCVEYMAYPITDGVLSLASSSTLVNDNINSQNRIDIYNCKVDKKIKGMNPEFNIPLRAGVYILTDRKGNIQLDLPVSGNIDDPTFSYKKIILKTLGNLFVKVVASPIDFLVKALGGEPDLFADITYDIHPQGLGSEASDKLNKIADALKEKTEITLTIQQSLDMEENMQEYALFSAKRDFYMRDRQVQQPTLADFEAIQEIKKTDKNFVAYVNERAGENAQGDIYAKCLSLYDPSVIKQQINANVERRNQQIVNQLTSQGVERSRLQVLPLGDKKTPKGKTLVSFDVKVPEE